ncbi:MAG: hypothetical protein ACAI34_02925 [Verrucomicrobium sp.]|nr:hypothetical protein [Verrucomicrobium sp.]
MAASRRKHDEIKMRKAGHGPTLAQREETGGANVRSRNDILWSFQVTTPARDHDHCRPMDGNGRCA